MESPAVTDPTLTPLLGVAEIHRRLQLIFPDGTPNRAYCTRDMAAKTIFAMLYVGAIEDAGVWLAPKHVYRMTDDQAARTSAEERAQYARVAMQPGFDPGGARWYADTTREPIRDETLREGLVVVGAAMMRTGLPTTSSKPRYALRCDFADLFLPDISDVELADAIARWQTAHLSKGALTRVALRRRGGADSAGVSVTFPNNETRRLAPGPSSEIARAVIESFAPRFLKEPFVLWLSESGNKVVARDDTLASDVGLKIQADRELPDLILVDLGPADPLILFVEIVATDGPITERRRQTLVAIAEAGGFDACRVAFLSAFADRDAPGYRKTYRSLAWGSFAWFASEPDKLLVLRDGGIELERLVMLDTAN
jgi:hypothetical protein